MVEHKLKTWPGYYKAIIDGRKTFELRTNDRDFKEFDTLRLMEWAGFRDAYTGRECLVRVKYIVAGEMWLKTGVVAMSIELIRDDAMGAARR